MLLWQQLNLHKNSSFFISLLCTSIFFHSVILLLLFFVYREPRSFITLIIDGALLHQHEPVIFISPQLKSQQTSLRASSQKTSTANLPMQKKPPMQKKHSPQNKASTSTTHKTVIQKGHDKQKKSEQSIQKTVTQEKSKLHSQKKKKDLSQAKKTNINDDSAVQNDTIKTVEEYRQYESFYASIAHSWKPPIGSALDCTCQITMHIAWDGSVQKLVIDKSSGILMYDVAARNALYNMFIPSWAYGKSLTVLLRQ